MTKQNKKEKVNKENIQTTSEVQKIDPAKEKYFDLMLENAKLKLLNHNRFYSIILFNVHIEKSYDVPTAGVCYHDNKLIMYINPKFFCSLPEYYQVGILQHELDHVIHGHIYKKRLQNFEYIKLANIAYDLVINQNNKFLKKVAKSKNNALVRPITIDQYKLPPRLTAEQYYESLKKKLKQCKSCKRKYLETPNPNNSGNDVSGNSQNSSTSQAENKGNPKEKNKKNNKKNNQQDKNNTQQQSDQNQMQQDSNSSCCDNKCKECGGCSCQDEDNGFDKHDWQIGEKEAEEIKRHVKKIVKEALDKSAGDIPGELKRTIENSLGLNQSNINWRAILHNLVFKHLDINTKTTRHRYNKRYGIAFPGKRYVPKIKLAVCIDTSASISNKELNTFMSEIYKINMLEKSEIHIIECDATVQNVYKLKKNQKIKSTAGGGGTSFGPALKKASELDPDCIIYFTDGDNYDRPKKPQYPIIWVLTNKSQYDKFSIKWGYKLYIDSKT